MSMPEDVPFPREIEARKAARVKEAHEEINRLLTLAMDLCAAAARHALDNDLYDRAQNALSHRSTIDWSIREEPGQKETTHGG